MLEIRLVLKNIKNQVKQYFVYFVGIIIVMSLLITYLNFSTSIIKSLDTIKESGNIYALSSFVFTLIFVSILIFLFLLFILIYGNKMMRKLKAREYGLYKLYGISNKKLFRLIFLEQITILFISFIISLIIGILLTMLLVFLVNLSIKEYLYDGFSIGLSWKNYVYILIVFMIEGLITSYLSYKAVRKKEVINLLVEQTDLKPVRPMSTFRFYFYLIVCIIIYGVMLYTLQKQLKLLNGDEILLLLIAWCTVIYLSYKVLAYILIKILPKKILYKNENIFTFSIINRKLSSSLKVMTFITIFLIFLFALIFTGGYMQNNIKMKYQQEDVIVTTNYEIYRFDDYTFKYNRLYDYNVRSDNDDGSYNGTNGFEVVLESDVNRFLKENNFPTIQLDEKEAIVVNPGDSGKKEYVVEGWEGEELFTVQVKDAINLERRTSTSDTYDPSLLIVSDENIKEPYNEKYEQKNDILNKYEGKYNYGAIQVYNYVYCDEICYNYEMISESDMNKYFELKNYDMKMDLSYNDFGLVGSLHDYNFDVQNWKQIWVEGKGYPIVEKEELYIPEFVNNSSNYVVVSDEQIDEIKSIAEAEYEIEYLDYKEDIKVQDKDWIKLGRTPNMNLYIKSQEVTNLYLSNLIAISFTTFISFVILILLICIVAMQTTIDSIENKKEFKKLRNINYTNRDLRRSVNKITFVYFVVPIIVAVINIYMLFLPLMQYLNSDTVYVLQFMDYKFVIYIIIIILVIYVLFFLLINYSYKKVVIKNK